MSARGGVTLIELLVVLVLLGLLFMVSGLALASLGTPKGAARARALTAARSRAIRSGVPVFADGDSVVVGASRLPQPTPVLFLPDGRAIGPGMDPLTGAPFANR